MPKASATSSYPRICVRFIAGVYHWLPVQPIETAPEHPPAPGKILQFLDPAPGEGPGWPPERCEALIARAELLCRQQGKSVCVVFGPRDAVYLEPDGRRKQSDEPPWGGVGLTGGVNLDLDPTGEGVREPPPTSKEQLEAMLDRHFPDRHELPDDDEVDEDEVDELQPDEGFVVVCSGDLGGDVWFDEDFAAVEEVRHLLCCLEPEHEARFDWEVHLEGLPMFDRLPQLEWPPLGDHRQLEEIGPFWAEIGEPICDFPGRTFHQLLVEVREEHREHVQEQFGELARRLRPIVEEIWE
ncbi:MAG: hypothetical protein P1V51_23330 [Deltaproteobacteria bacterium]|nr:hypothetical protein [Deltaproteobacteria bacterium]